MARIRQTDTAAQTGLGIPDEARGPRDDADLEMDLEKAERRLRSEHDHRVFGEHPNGIGPTLGQDLGQPNPGHAVDWNDESYDPPT
jgi:hypothetical protein